MDERWKAAAESGRFPGAAAGEAESGLLGPDGHVRAMAEIEAAAIRLALRRYGGNLSEAARRLGIGRSTLYRKLAARAEAGD